MYRIAMLGVQGSGKGTQAEILAARLHIPQITPGAMFRREIATGSEMGKRVAALIDRGEMAPHAYTNTLIKNRIEEADCVGGYILDGYPRATEQQEDLDQFAQPLSHVIVLEIPDSVAVERLSQRWVCVCGKSFAEKEISIRPGDESSCGQCEGELRRRPDDEPEAIRRRLAIYHAETEPVVVEYHRRGIAHRIDGIGAIDEVAQRVAGAVGNESCS
jgi:adenylate kinase